MATTYGDNKIYEDIRDALYNQMEAMRLAMASDSPKPAAVYSTHGVVKMTLPAISIGFESVSLRGEETGRSAGASPAIRQTYDFNYQIRVHTDFRGGHLQRTTLMRLLNSISNYITSHDNIAITGHCRTVISGIGTGDSFDDSLTIGGHVNVLLVIQLLHTQT